MLKDYQGMAKIGVWPPLLCIFDNCALKRRCCVWAHFGLLQWSRLPCKNITPDRGEPPARPSCCPLPTAILPKGCLPCTSTPKNRGTSLQTPRWGSEKIPGDQAVRVHFVRGVGVPFACTHRGGRARPCGAKAAAASSSAGFSICVTSSRFWPCVDKLPYLQSIIPLDSVIAFPGSHVSHAL